MINSFKDEETEKVYNAVRSKKLSGDIQQTALRKLKYLNNAQDLNDLRIPPGNCLEALHGDRQGQHSIRINDQWRVCFTWNRTGANDVEIVDYH